MNKNVIHSLELARVVAIFSILAMHCALFTTYPIIDDIPWVGYLFNQSTRFSVPLFFLLAGYFIQPKIDKAPIASLRSYSLPLLRVWLVWSVIYLVLPFRGDVLIEQGYLAERMVYFDYLYQNMPSTLLQGGFGHLWFIPALIMGVAIIAILITLKLHRLLLPTAIALYLYGVLAGSYSVVTDLPSPFFTRNGPFFSTLMIVIGYLIRQNKVKVKPTLALIMLICGMLIHFSEGYLLHGYGAPFNANDYLFGTVLWATGILLLLLNYPSIGDYKWVHYLSRRVLAIYVSHMIFIIYMMNVEVLLNLEYVARDLLLLGGSIGFTLGLIALIERTPLQKWLYR